jgi:hypothetical protein
VCAIDDFAEHWTVAEYSDTGVKSASDPERQLKVGLTDDPGSRHYVHDSVLLVEYGGAAVSSGSNYQARALMPTRVSDIFERYAAKETIRVHWKTPVLICTFAGA